MSARVVISGMGVVSAVGNTVAEFSQAVLAGRSGAGPVTRFDARAFPTRIAAEVHDFEPVGGDGARAVSVEDRKTAFAEAAARQAWAAAHWEAADFDPHRVGISLGTGLSSVVAPELEEDLVPFFTDDGALDVAAYGRTVVDRGRFSPARHLTDQANRELARLFGARGPSRSHFSACAASLQAIGWGLQAIRDGRLDAVIAGGQDSMVHPYGMISFMLLGALSTHNDEPGAACRPFDERRDGFVMGEGAAVLVLETAESATARGAEIFAELIGFGTSVDGHNATAPDPEGAGAAAAMTHALRDADLAPADIDYINAHGTGTALNDPAEAQAVMRVFGEAAAHTPISSVKPLFGHCIAAAGALEAVACVAALGSGRLPPNANLETPARECAGLDLVIGEGRETRPQRVMTNNYGFGGQNASLILRTWTDEEHR